MDPQQSAANPAEQQSGNNTGGDHATFGLPLGNPTVQSTTKGNAANSNAPAPPRALLTTGNLVEHTGQKKTYVRPPPTVDERLKQAKNFLSDEGVYSLPLFREHFWEIESLLRTLSEEKVPCESVLFRKVRDMLRVQKARLDQLDNPIAETVDPGLLAQYSTRLPTQDPAGIEEARYALRKEDHAPFTINRKPDHAQFVRAFRANNKAGKSLREIERGAYFRTLKDPSLISEDLKENTYEERASKRGRRRAALQLALCAIGGNEEQTFEGDWMQRIVSLPQPPTLKAEEPRMCQGLAKSERPPEPDRFGWTKRNIRFQQEQSQLVSWINDERAQNRDGQSPTEPVMFYKATQKSSVVAYRLERRLARLVQVAFGILARVSYDHTSKAIEDAQEPSSPEAQVLVRAMTEGLIAGDANDTRDVPSATQLELLQEYAKAGGGLFQDEVDFDAVYSPLDDVQLARLEDCSVDGLSQPDADTGILLHTLRVELLDLIDMLKIGNPTNYSEEERNFDQESLKAFRDDVVGKIRETSSLVTDRILTENHDDVRDRKLEHSKIWSFSTTLPEISKLQNYFSMEKWPTQSPSLPDRQPAAQEATGKRKATTPLATAPPAKRQRDKYRPEATGGKRKATTDPETAREPKRSPYAVDYRSLDPTDKKPSRRLAPEELGFQVVKETAVEGTLRVGKGDLMPPEIKDFDVQKHGQILENAPDPREKRLKGDARFPFGETSITSLALNTQIGRELGGARGADTSTALAQHRPQDRNPATRETTLPIPPKVGWTLPSPPPQLQIDQLQQSAIFTTRGARGTIQNPAIGPTNSTGAI